LDLKELAEREGADWRALEKECDAGRAVILEHMGKPAVALSRLCSTKINTNLGISAGNGVRGEMRKLRIAEKHGTDTVMDLSICDTDSTLREFLIHSKVPVGTVPIYRCEPETCADEDFLKAIESHARIGASFMTIHAAMKKRAAEFAIRKRVTKIVSRGGGILAQYMLEKKCENPLYRNFDSILDMLRGTEIGISLGDALRPGCIADANDRAQVSELRVQGELVLRARKAGVQVFCEGPGHMPLGTIVANVKLQKKLCHGAPYYVLGPLVTDSGLGYDHISAAVGATIAAHAGVEFLCALTPSEHYALPDEDDIREGVVAFKIAAHAADVARGRKEALSRDLALSRARFGLDWRTQEQLSVTGKKVCAGNGAPCSMCLGTCPMKRMAKFASRSSFVASRALKK